SVHAASQCRENSRPAYTDEPAARFGSAHLGAARGLLCPPAMTRTLGLATAASLLLLAGSAAAQPGAYAPPAAPPPAAPEPPRWGIGLRTTALSLVNQADERDHTELGGGGLHLRYRFASHWRAELTLEGAAGEPALPKRVGVERTT